MKEGQSIVFAFYKGNKLIGYRLDTMGSIGVDGPKIYTYSQSQIETVLKNIEHNVKESSGFGKALGIEMLSERENEIHNFLQDQKAFEVRVVKAPDKVYEKIFNVEKAIYETSIWPTYPIEQIKQWLLYPEQHETIETHWFSIAGRMNLQ